MRSAMGTIAADMILGIILIRQCIHICIRKHCLMECRIKSYHLGDIGKHLGDGMDAKKVRGIVKRCEVTADFNLFQDIIINKSTPIEEIGTLYYTVADSLDIVKGA